MAWNPAFPPTHYIAGLNQQPNAAQARAYLGISGQPGSGTVTNDADLLEHVVVVGDGEEGIKVIDDGPGTAGQVLTSNGPNADPSFETPAAGPAGPTGPTGATGATGATGPQGPPGTPAAVQVFSGNFGGVEPVAVVPTTSAAICYDLDPPFQLWKWSGAAWT